MKVLIVSYESPPNCAGIGFSFERLLKAFSDKGFKPDVLAGNHTKEWLPKAIVKYWTTPKRYDLIHFWGALPTLLLPIKNRPFIITAHGSDVPGRNREYDAFFAKKWLGYSNAWYRAKRFYAVTDGLSEMVEKYYKLKCKTIPNGVTYRDIKRNKPLHPMLVTVGRLVKLKRTHLLIELMQHLPSGHLTIVGDGPERESLELMAKNLGVASRVAFVGWSSPTEYLAGGYIYVSAADATGAPLAMYEAIEHRLPIVMVNTPGVDHINAVKVLPDSHSLLFGVNKAMSEYEKWIPQPGVKTWSDIADEYIAEYWEVT